MGLKQYKSGKKFEEELCWWFANRDFFVIYNEKGATGAQPCDIIVIKNNFTRLIECKNLENSRGIFNLDRIEANQFMAYNRYKKCNNSAFELAILWSNNVYFLNFDLLQHFDKSIDLKLIQPDIPNFVEE